MSEWITDREPHYRDDCYYVFNAYGKVTHWAQIQRGEAWMPIVSPEPYVKPKRWRVSRFGDEFTAYDSVQREHVTPFLPTREAAERIAAIYEEVMP
jgi:hypothetical protein